MGSVYVGFYYGDTSIYKPYPSCVKQDRVAATGFVSRQRLILQYEDFLLYNIARAVRNPKLEIEGTRSTRPILAPRSQSLKHETPEPET